MEKFMGGELVITHSSFRGVPNVKVKSHGIATVSQKGEEYAIKAHKRKIKKLVKDGQLEITE